MSKGIEEVPDKKINLSLMSERQALLYFQNGGGNEDQTKERPNSLLDYHQYFMFKKEAQHSLVDKNKLIERNRVLKLALKEYTQIKKNIYLDRKKCVFTDDEAYVCTCFPKKYTQTEAKRIIEEGYSTKSEEELFGCGRSCINRMVTWECVEHLCPCGASCRNRKFQNHEYADVYPIKTDDRGFGLCAGSFLPKGTFIIQYIGEVYSVDSDFGQKKLEEYKDHTCTYLMSLSKNEVIDPTTKGNFARFINHSCDPNCETQKWHVLGEVCVGIFTIKDIQPDAELTFNYGFNILKTTFQKCLCGTSTCRGYLGIVTTDSPQTGQNVIVCEACKTNCKQSEPILVCDICKKVYHKKCSKKGKGNNHNYTCHHCIKKGVHKKPEIKEKIVKIEEEPVYDENYEVGDEELGKIRKNLPLLINCGARLFWNFQLQNSILGTSKKLDIKITGTSTQIENVKKKIKQLREQKSDSNSLFIIKLQVPKVFVRKIIGHQNRNLNAYKSKFGVQIDYDISLITDEIFPIQESSFIQIKGKENNVKAVENDIKSYLYNLKVLTIFLMPSDYSFIKGNICNLKTIIDPADVRLRKRELKNERDLKHPFYFISNTNRDIVVIGFDREVEKGEKIIKEFILRHNTLLYNYSLSFLYPIYFRKQLNNFLNENKNAIRDKKIYFDLIEPEYLRRHLSIYLEGKWKDITEIKNAIWKYAKESPDEGTMSMNSKKHSITEFEQYAFNQEHKLISKSIKNNIIDTSYQIKNWDYISEDVRKLTNCKEKKEGSSDNHQQHSYTRKQNESSSLLKNFPTTCDRDTKLNYLINFPPGSYATIFKRSQNEVTSNLLSLLTEAFDSYKESKLKGYSNAMNVVQDTKEVLSIKPPSSMIIEDKSVTMNKDGNDKVKVNGPEHILLKQELTGISRENADMNLNLHHNNSAFSIITPLESIPLASSPIEIDKGINSLLISEEASKQKLKEEQQNIEINHDQNEMIVPLIEESISLNHPEPKLINDIQLLKDDNQIKEQIREENNNEETNINNNTNANLNNETDPLKISYSFPTIQQMNINININDIKNYIDKKETKTNNNNEDSYGNYIQNKKDSILKEKKLVYSIQKKSSKAKSKSNNDSESNSSFLQRKRKKSQGKDDSPSEKNNGRNASSNKHQYDYHYSSKNKDRDSSGYYEHSYSKRKDSPHYDQKRYYVNYAQDHHQNSRSPSPVSPKRKTHVNYNYNCNYHYDYSPNYKSKSSKYDTMNSKYQYDQSGAYDSSNYSKPYHQQHRYIDSYDKRDQSNYNYKRYHEREKQNFNGSINRNYLHSGSPHSRSHSRTYSRQKSKSPNQKYAYYSSIRKSSPKAPHDEIKKTEQNQTSSVDISNDLPSNNSNYKQLSHPKLKNK